MDKSILAIIGLRAAALAVGLAGQAKASGALYAAADAIESGRATDEHMRLVAEKLKAGPVSDADWQDVSDRIAADRATLHGR